MRSADSRFAKLVVLDQTADFFMTVILDRLNQLIREYRSVIRRLECAAISPSQAQALQEALDAKTRVVIEVYPRAAAVFSLQAELRELISEGAPEVGAFFFRSLPKWREEVVSFAFEKFLRDHAAISQEQAEVETAPPFFSEHELPRIDKTQPKFQCTGERLWCDRPDVYKAVVRLLVEPGVSLRTICRDCHVTDHTVRSVKDPEAGSIATVKALSNVTHDLRIECGPPSIDIFKKLGELVAEANKKFAEAKQARATEISSKEIGAPAALNGKEAGEISCPSFIQPRNPIATRKKRSGAFHTDAGPEKFRTKALRNGDQEKPRGADAQDGSANGDLEAAATLVADESATLNQAQV